MQAEISSLTQFLQDEIAQSTHLKEAYESQSNELRALAAQEREVYQDTRVTSQQQLQQDSLQQELDAMQHRVAAQQETIELQQQELSRLRAASQARSTELASAEEQLGHAQEDIAMLKHELSDVLHEQEHGRLSAESTTERELREECEAQAKLLQQAEWDRQALEEELGMLSGQSMARLGAELTQRVELQSKLSEMERVADGAEGLQIQKLELHERYPSSHGRHHN